MNIQKKDTNIQSEIIHKDRGDMIKRKEAQGSVPRDRGDANRNKKSSKQVLFKTTKSDKAENSNVSELVSRSTNTLIESASGSLESRAKHGTSCAKSVDFRKRIKDRYTFKKQQKVDKKDGDISKINDVKKELPNPSNPESSNKNKSKDSAKNGARLKDKVAVHRAVSAMKVKPTKPTLTMTDRIKDTAEKIRRKDRHRKPVIQTITSKVDNMRVYKAVTFIEKVQRQPLHITIPNKDSTPKSKSRIPVSVPKSPSVKRVGKRRKVQRRSSESSGCLPTEVAQWAPESINQQTIPYYEAWLSKTATASTKYSKEERESILRDKALKPRSPVEYNLGEEDAGRIRVRRKVK